MNSQFELPLIAINTYCKNQPIKRLALFGSVLREDFTKDSDIDVLIEFVKDAGITYFDLFDIKETLQEMIGREVDLLTPAAISDHFRDDVLKQAVTIYEQ